jgi:chromosome segregation ATPase
MAAELSIIKAEGDKRVEQVLIEQQRKSNEITEKSMNEAGKIKRESELELRELKRKHEEETSRLNMNLETLRKKLSEASERNSIFESSDRQQSNKISRLEEDLNKYLKEYELMKAENKELSERRFHNEKTITELTCKLDSLRSEIEDKKTIISSTVQNKETISSQIATLEGQNTEQKKQIVKLENKITDLEAELAKLNSSNAELL